MERHGAIGRFRMCAGLMLRRRAKVSGVLINGEKISAPGATRHGARCNQQSRVYTSEGLSLVVVSIHSCMPTSEVTRRDEDVTWHVFQNRRVAGVGWNDLLVVCPLAVARTHH